MMKDEVKNIIERIEEHFESAEEDFMLWPDDEKGPYPLDRIFQANAKFLNILKEKYLKVPTKVGLVEDASIRPLKISLEKLEVAPDAYNAQLERFPIGFKTGGFISPRVTIEPDTALVLYAENLYTPIFHTSLIREVLHVGEKHIDFKTINSVYRLNFLD